MDDLDFIKQHLPKLVNEGKFYQSSDEMLRSLMRSLDTALDAESNAAAEEGRPPSGLFKEIERIYDEYMNAQVG